MTLTLTKAPETKPVTLDAVKTHLRLEHDFDDPYLKTLVETAVYYIQNDLNRSLITQEWTFIWRKRPSLVQSETLFSEEAVVELSYPPLQEILSVNTLRFNGQKKLVKRFVLDISQEKPQVHLALKDSAVEICYRAGFGHESEHVPGPIRQALLMLVTHFYQNRSLEAVKKDALLQELIAPYRLKKLI